MKIIQLPLTAATERSDRNKDTAGTVRAALIWFIGEGSPPTATEKAQAFKVLRALDDLVLGARSR